MNIFIHSLPYLSTTIPNRTGVDLTVNTAVIIVAATALSSIFVALINGWFQYLVKKQENLHAKDEYENQLNLKKIDNSHNLKKYQWETYYKNATDVFTSMLTEVGKYLGYPSDTKLYMNALSSVYQAKAFGNETINNNLDFLYECLYLLYNDESERNTIMAMDALKIVADKINSQLIQSIQE